MRIGFDGIPLAQSRTGVGTYTLELARALAAMVPQDEFELISGLPFDRGVYSVTKPVNLKLVHERPRLFQRSWWTIGLPSYLKRNALDLFHGTNYEVPLRGQCPPVVTIHDLSLVLHPETHPPRAVARARLLIPLMARKSRLIITPSEFIKNEVCDYLKIESDRVFATPLAPRGSFTPMALAETVETRRRLNVEDGFLLFVGTIEPRKNLLILLRALEELLRTTDLRPQLVVVGKAGWKSNELVGVLKRSVAHERVKYLGFVSDEDLRALYSSCRVFIYPSTYEGFGLPPLEAMACGAPVVTTRVPSTKECAARIVSSTDFRQLAQVLSELLTDDQARDTLIIRGREYSQQFSWQRTAALTREVYEQALT
jgi:glycosyltransferase involved in cell wall biosynthesis